MIPPADTKLRITYLIGAGATHACAKFVSSPYSVLTRDLSDELAKKVNEVATRDFSSVPEIRDLVNAVIDDSVDFEHIITFLDESVSARHRELARALRSIFGDVLRGRLAAIEAGHGSQPNDLYAALLDLYEVPGIEEELRGLLTLNYDTYIETAATQVQKRSVDLGIGMRSSNQGQPPISVLKLHGSFGWGEAWPVSFADIDVPLWIPPGIQKAKGSYPFNLIWGRARELLDCDVLRVIGCRLGANDWDLVSMLFGTRLCRSVGRPYDIEVIDAPARARELKATFPYLNVKSLFEIDRIGDQLVSELVGGAPRGFAAMTDSEQEAAIDAAGMSQNWFLLWLTQKAEDLHMTHGSVSTSAGSLERVVRGAQ